MNIIFFDTETTGLDSSKERLCSLSLITDKGERKNYLFNPEKEVDPKASKVNGFTWDNLKLFPKFKDVAEELKTILEKADLLVAHNAKFDIGFLKAEFKRAQIEFKPKAIACTMKMAQEKVVSESYSLDTLTNHFGLKQLRESTHGADIDTEMCKNLYYKLISIEPDSKIDEMILKRNKIVEAMEYGPVAISFVKKDGTIRKAVASLTNEAIAMAYDLDHQPSTSWMNVDFVDTSINKWRMFNFLRLKSWKKLY